jgi:predicted MFS family arabinose efflux permease
LSVGTALGVPVGLLIENELGWRWTIGLIALLGLIAAAGVAGRPGHFPIAPAVTWRERWAALRAPFTLATLGVTLWTGMASLGLYTYLAEVAAARGVAQATHAFIWVWGWGGMAGALLIGRIIDNYLSPTRATPGLLLLMAAGFALVGWGMPAEIGIGIGCFAWGLAGWASMAPQQHALVSHQAAHATALIAWNSSINYLGSAIGAALGAVALSAHVPARWLPAGALAAVVVALVIHLAKTKYATIGA